jgi:hypothetical protein
MALEVALAEEYAWPGEEATPCTSMTQTISQWQELRDLRRDAEGIAQRELAEASAVLERAQEEQARLVRAWERARTLFAAEARRLASSPAPSSASQGSARELYLGRLRDEACFLKASADEHRGSVLAVAHAAQQRAMAELAKAARDRAALNAVESTARLARVRTITRRAEEAASELATLARLRVRSGRAT